MTSAVPVTTAPPQGIPPVSATAEEIEAARRALARASGPLACDVERAQGFVYSSKAYLLQLARADAGIYLIDPVGEGAGALRELAGTISGAEFILHAADQDLANLRELGIEPGALFDTEIAAMILGRPHVGLAALVEEICGVRLAKEHQASNWSQRPLPEDWRAYAALDVAYLEQLRDRLSDDLAEAGRLSWAEQEFDHVLHQPAKPPKPDPWRVKGAGRIRDQRTLAALRELWLARDALGRDADIEPAKFLATRALVPLAQAAPRSWREVSRSIPETRFRRARAYADVWLEALARARDLPEDELPPVRRPLSHDELPPVREWRHRNPDARARLTRLKAGIGELAESVNVRADLLLSPAAQRRLSWEGTRSPSLDERMARLGARPWQIDLVAQIVDDALRG